MQTLTIPDDHKLYIVTVKVAKDPEHDPRNKKTASCITGVCTDATGEHHSYISSGPSLEAVREACPFKHVTRIEEVPLSDWRPAD